MLERLLRTVSSVPHHPLPQPHCLSWRSLIGAFQPSVKLFGHLAVLPPEEPSRTTVDRTGSAEEAAQLVGGRMAQYFHKLRVQHHNVRDVSLLCAWWRVDAQDAPAYDDWQRPIYAPKDELREGRAARSSPPPSLDDADGEGSVFTVPEKFPSEHRRRLEGDTVMDPLTRVLIMFNQERRLAERCRAHLESVPQRRKATAPASGVSHAPSPLSPSASSAPSSTTSSAAAARKPAVASFAATTEGAKGLRMPSPRRGRTPTLAASAAPIDGLPFDDPVVPDFPTPAVGVAGRSSAEQLDDFIHSALEAPKVRQRAAFVEV